MYPPRPLRWAGAKSPQGGFCISGGSPIITNVYIDGFNFYYGALRKTPYRWVNIRRLCELLLPKNTIAEIKYFTALVSARPNSPDQPIHQQLYLRALRTLPQKELAQ